MGGKVESQESGSVLMKDYLTKSKGWLFTEIAALAALLLLPSCFPGPSQPFDPTAKHPRTFIYMNFLKMVLGHLLPQAAQSCSPSKQHLKLLCEAEYHKRLITCFLFITKVQLSDAFLWVPKAEKG